ncbi:MAG: cysteine dioxygenase family protein [Cyanobacteria bacterium P01_C01_bin.72]
MTQTVEFARDNQSFSRLPRSLQNLVVLLSQTSSMTSKRVEQYLKQAQISSEDLQSWETFDHSVRDSYGRQLVYDGGYFEIMVMSWLPGDVSAIHDHGQAQWGAVQCFGAGTHSVYRLVENQVFTEAEIALLPMEIMKVNHSLIHQMSNHSSEPFLSLHVYGCYDHQDLITGNARIFDLLEGRVQHTNGGVFFCLPESEIISRGQTLEADRLTTLKHHQQMRDRLLNILDHSEPNLGYWESKLALVESKIQELSTAISLVG